MKPMKQIDRDYACPMQARRKAANRFVAAMCVMSVLSLLAIIWGVT